MNAKGRTNIANRICTLAQNGLVYSTNEYEMERYTELFDLSDRILSGMSGYDTTEIHLWSGD